MTLGDYIKVLKGIEKLHGSKLVLVSASDEEGNSFSEVYYSPTPGRFNGDQFEDDAKKPTHLCVN
jgi:hypothetical protein